MSRFFAAMMLVMSLFLPMTATAAEAAKVDTGDTAWMLVSTALVMLMTPGLALFYGGMVRKKNVLGTIMHSFVAMAVISLQWMIIGYSLAFGPDLGGFVGGLDWIGLNGVGTAPNADYAPTIPHILFMAYQMMFAIITPALISGAVAERMRFSAYLIFIVIWSTLVYDPVCHWIWGTGGWMKNMGVLDFAGGVVVHVTSGLSALVAAIMVKRRRGFPHEAIMPHDLPMTALGTGLLWFGWFGFNAGSALSSGGTSAMTFAVTHASAVSATVAWVILEWRHRGKPTMFGAATGCIAGLATVTPASGFVSVPSALLIGSLAASVCYTALNMKVRYGYDDSLDAFGVHGVGGVLGTLALGFLAQKAVNPTGSDGLLFGNPGFLATQVMAIVVTAVYSMAVTYVALRIIDMVVGLRVDDEEELMGLDVSQHGENAYTS